MMYFLSVVLIGTIYPIFLEVLSSQKISVGPPFYHKLIIPFLIPFLMAMAIGPKLKWIKSNIVDKFYLVLFFAISIVLSFLIVKKFSTNLLINTILLSSALYLFFITLRDFFIRKYSNISQNIAHFGFSLLILSILLNNLLVFFDLLISFIKLPVSILTGHSTAKVSVDNGTFKSAGSLDTIDSGMPFEVQLTASSTAGVSRSATVTIAGKSVTYTITTAGSYSGSYGGGGSGGGGFQDDTELR